MTSLTLPSDDLTLHATLVSADAPHGLALLAHGITADRHEDGFFTQLAAILAAKAGISSLRFDFRGHGESSGPSTVATVDGEVRDINNALAELRTHEPGLPLGVIAASFGAVAASHLLAMNSADFAFAVLLNPVLDMRRTFIEPELPWARESFTPAAVRASLVEGATLTIDDHFTISADFVRDMHVGPEPLELLADVRLPMLVVHGDADTYVSVGIAESFARTHPTTDFRAIVGAEHGFERAEDAAAVADIVADWINAL
jgi:uncharacterized protein